MAENWYNHPGGAAPYNYGNAYGGQPPFGSPEPHQRYGTPPPQAPLRQAPMPQAAPQAPMAQAPMPQAPMAQAPMPQYRPVPPQVAPPNMGMPAVWGGDPEPRPWYLNTWFIVLLAMFWVPLPVSIVLMIKQKRFDRKMAAHGKKIRDAEAYWAYVKEDSARIYREASEKSDALLRDSKIKKLELEKQSNEKLIRTDRDCKALRIKLERETKDLLVKRDQLRAECDLLQNQVDMLQNRQILMADPDDFS